MSVRLPAGVSVAMLSGSLPVEVSYPCVGCDDPGHLAIRFMNDSYGAYGAWPYELHDPTPAARALIRMARREAP